MEETRKYRLIFLPEKVYQTIQNGIGATKLAAYEPLHAQGMDNLYFMDDGVIFLDEKYRPELTEKARKGIQL